MIARVIYGLVAIFMALFGLALTARWISDGFIQDHDLEGGIALTFLAWMLWGAVRNPEGYWKG
jgi:hypothetical protein